MVPGYSKHRDMHKSVTIEGTSPSVAIECDYIKRELISSYDDIWYTITTRKDEDVLLLHDRRP